jgi:hypothetical protein
MRSKQNCIILILCIISINPLFSQAAKEIEYLTQGFKVDDVKVIMESILLLERKIDEIDLKHDTLWEEEKTSIEKSFIPAFNSLKNLEVEIWETDKEFEQRIELERQRIQTELDRNLNDAYNFALASRNKSKSPYEDWLEETNRNLSKTWRVHSTQLYIVPQVYQRNERRWPIYISSFHPLIHFDNFEVVIDFESPQYAVSTDSIDMRQEIIDFDNAVKTNKLTCIINWQVYWDNRKTVIKEDSPIDLFDVVESTEIVIKAPNVPPPLPEIKKEDNLVESSIKEKSTKRFVLGIVEVRIINEINGIEYVFEYPDAILTNAFNVIGSNQMDVQVEETSVITDIKVLSPMVISPNELFKPRFQIYPENSFNKSLKLSIEKTPLIELDEKNNTVRAFNFTGKSILTVKSSDGFFNKQIELIVEYRIGNKGPAGGYIFYDAGDNSRGWRYLEAAPEDLFNWTSWGDTSKYENIRVKTDTKIGTGKQNTIDIARFINSRDNAAQRCLDYKVNGYDDWFLPSKDELNEMITTLIDLLGRSTAQFESLEYWSSSSRGVSGLGTSLAWIQSSYPNFRQKELEVLYTAPAIRPIRMVHDADRVEPVAIPEEYLVPVTPAVPEEYLVPVTPSVPEEYLVPVTPSVPEEYLVPVTPAVPEEYLVPVTPSVPEEYLVPVTPSVPEEYLVPVTPLVPEEYWWVIATEEVAEEHVVIATEEVPEEPVVIATEEVAEEPVVIAIEEVPEEPVEIATEEVAEEPVVIAIEEVAEEPVVIATEEDYAEPEISVIKKDSFNLIQNYSEPKPKNQSDGFGIGLSLGYPVNGIVAKYDIDSFQLVGTLGFSFDSYISVEVGYQVDITDIKIDDVPIYMNLGYTVAMRFEKDFKLLFNVPIGFSYYFEAFDEYATEVFFKIMPGFMVFPSIEFDIGAIIGVLYYFN